MTKLQTDHAQELQDVKEQSKKHEEELQQEVSGHFFHVCGYHESTLSNVLSVSSMMDFPPCKMGVLMCAALEVWTNITVNVLLFLEIPSCVTPEKASLCSVRR